MSTTKLISVVEEYLADLRRIRASGFAVQRDYHPLRHSKLTVTVSGGWSRRASQWP